MCDVEHAREVDRDDVLPVLDHGLGSAHHAVAAGDARVVDQDGDRADRGGGLFCHRRAGRAVGDIERKTVDGAAGVADQPGGFRGASALTSSATTRAPSRA